MNNPRGRVLSVSPGQDGVHAVVAVDDAPVCPRCAAGKGCGAGIFAAGSAARQIEAIAAEGIHPRVDDRVEISLAPDNLLRAAGTVYGLPMIGAIAGAGVAYWLWPGDAGAALLALLGLGAGLAVSRWRLRQATCLRQFTPRIERLC